MNDLTFVPIDRSGAPEGFAGELPQVAADALAATATLYDTVGFEKPWVGYLALAGDTPVGTCAFTSPPKNNRVEIAYFTFPPFEGRGVATAMARKLVETASRHASHVQVTARTLPERNASTRILEKLGFALAGPVVDPEDGEVWEWRLER